MEAACFGQQYTQTNLVSNTSGIAPVTDPQLINAWGLSRASSSPWWVSDEATGFATLYDGAGVKQSLVVTIPPADPTNKNTPTGTPTLLSRSMPEAGSFPGLAPSIRSPWRLGAG